MTSRRGRLALAVGLAAAGLLLQACATKPAVYGPITAEVPHGYADRVSSDGGFTILVRMPGNASVPMLRDFFDRRAAELCTTGVDRTNVFRVTANEHYADANYAYGTATAARGPASAPRWRATSTASPARPLRRRRPTSARPAA